MHPLFLCDVLRLTSYPQFIEWLMRLTSYPQFLEWLMRSKSGNMGLSCWLLDNGVPGLRKISIFLIRKAEHTLWFSKNFPTCSLCWCLQLILLAEKKNTKLEGLILTVKRSLEFFRSHMGKVNDFEESKSNLSASDTLKGRPQITPLKWSLISMWRHLEGGLIFNTLLF